jgi:hypothetical protein
MCFISHLFLKILYNPLSTHTVITRCIQPVGVEIGGKVELQSKEVMRTPK